MSNTNESVTVAGDMYWCNLTEPNQMSNKYQFDLCNLSERACDALDALGISVKANEKRPEQGAYITLKSSSPISAFTEDGEEIDCRIGNGSKAKVRVGFYDWKYQKKSGRSPSAKRIVVTDLIEYDNTGNINNEEAL